MTPVGYHTHQVTKLFSLQLMDIACLVSTKTHKNITINEREREGGTVGGGGGKRIKIKINKHAKQ